MSEEKKSMFHEGHRELQDRYGGRKVADALEAKRKRKVFTEEDRKFIESSHFFFLATAWKDTVDCSFKGGLPGFIRVSAPNQLSWPDYDGNRMYRSLGNILRNPNVGLLFIDFSNPENLRLRVNGTALIDENPEHFSDLPGAKRLIVVTVKEVFTNCPRYVPEMKFIEESVYSPRPNYEPPTPEWKSRDYIKEVIDD